MSGPKTTNYKINARRQKKLREKYFADKKKELTDNLNNTLNKLNDYQFIREHTIERVSGWIHEAFSSLDNKQIYKAQNQLNGIKKFMLKLDDFEVGHRNSHQEQEESRKTEFKNKSESIKIKLNKQKVFLNTLKNYDLNFDFIVNPVSEWIKNAEDSILSDDIYSAQNQLNGIELFINKHNDSINNKISIYDENQQIIDKLNTISDETEIMNPGIRQRIDKFTTLVQNQMKSNDKVSQNDLNNINQFIQQVSIIKEKHNLNKIEQNYVKDSLLSLFSDDANSNDDGSISGVINNQSVKISFENTSSNIIFNIDDSKGGSCQDTLKKINSHLMNNEIDLGQVKVVKTKQTINLNNTNTNVFNKNHQLKI